MMRCLNRCKNTGILVVLFVVLLCSLINVEAKDMRKKNTYPQWQKGMCYVTWSRNTYMTTSSDDSLEMLAATTNTEWVALVTNWYQKSYNSTEIKATHETPTDESLIHAIKEIHSLGMKVMLKPHLELTHSPGKWRGEIDFETEDEWQTWFNNYHNMIIHYAKMAEKHDVEMLCIGTELVYPATRRGDLWREKIIKTVRAIYSGDITYAANWDEEYSNIDFWDALDYAGIDAYFPLSVKENPSLQELKKGWNLWLIDIEHWQKKINKPVIFTECGYTSSTMAAKKPWEYVLPGEDVDLELQKRCYEALMQTVGKKDWFYGTYWWYWGTNKRMGGRGDKYFCIQNKPIEDLIRRWYRKIKK